MTQIGHNRPPRFNPATKRARLQAHIERLHEAVRYHEAAIRELRQLCATEAWQQYKSRQDLADPRRLFPSRLAKATADARRVQGEVRLMEAELLEQRRPQIARHERILDRLKADLADATARVVALTRELGEPVVA